MTLQVTPKQVHWHDMETMFWKGLGTLTRRNAPCRRAVNAERCSDCFCACARARVAQRLDVPSRFNQWREAAGLVPAQAAARAPCIPTGSCAPAQIRCTGECSHAWHAVRV